MPSARVKVLTSALGMFVRIPSTVNGILVFFSPGSNVFHYTLVRLRKTGEEKGHARANVSHPWIVYTRRVIQDPVFKEHGAHAILSCPSHLGIKWHQSFSI